MSGDRGRRIAVVVPALNEELAIREVAESILTRCSNLIVVDDGSTDATVQRIADLPLTLVRHEQPRGKGKALRSGFRKALELGCDGVLTMDGDGQHSADDIPRLLAAASAHPRQIVIGARLIGREQQPAARRRANRVADWFIGWACGQPMLDSQSGQRYYPAPVLALAERLRGGFVFETDILIRASRQDIGVVSVPIRARYHDELRCSHFKPLADGVRLTAFIAWTIVRGSFLPGRFRRWRKTPPTIFNGTTTDAD